MLVDTDVLIWYLRGNERAAETIRSVGRFDISAVTHMEIVQGMRNKRELRTLRRTLNEWSVGILTIDEAISMRAIFYVEQHFLSHSLRLADALIAATAVENGMPLLTANTRHYQMIPDLILDKFMP